MCSRQRRNERRGLCSALLRVGLGPAAQRADRVGILAGFTGAWHRAGAHGDPPGAQWYSRARARRYCEVKACRIAIVFGPAALAPFMCGFKRMSLPVWRAPRVSAELVSGHVRVTAGAVAAFVFLRISRTPLPRLDVDKPRQSTAGPRTRHASKPVTRERACVPRDGSHA
jgi:hypothetical protein